MDKHRAYTDLLRRHRATVDDGVHYDSVVDHASYSFVGEDPVTLFYNDGYTGGFCVMRCLLTRSWYAETHSYYTYTLERLR